MIGRRWTLLLTVFFVALLAWSLVYADQIRRSLRENAESITQIYARALAGLNDPDPNASVEALWEVQGIILDARVPMILSGPGDSVLAVANLPFDADVRTPEGQALAREHVRVLDAANTPVGSPSGTLLHFGDPPEALRLLYVPWLLAGGLLLTVLLGLTLIRAQRRADAERAWTSMARELAHQLGTPLSSLQGWMELLRLPQSERPGDMGALDISDHIEGDLERLERVSRRFELIGRTVALEPIRVTAVLDDLEQYLRARLPRLGPGVFLEVEVPDDLPPVNGNRVLLVWALENVVKNSLDALAGGGGKISIQAQRDGDRWIDLRLSDDGPGVPIEIRDRLFEPGVTTKSGGWGVGLALARRIVEGVHGGKMTLLDPVGPGAVFLVKLPRAGG